MVPKPVEMGNCGIRLVAIWPRNVSITTCWVNIQFYLPTYSENLKVYTTRGIPLNGIFSPLTWSLVVGELNDKSV